MLATRVVCPHCSRHLKTPRPLPVGARAHCPGCGARFTVAADTRYSPDRPAPAAAAPAPAPAAPRSIRSAALVGLVLGGIALVMGAAVVLALHFSRSQDRPSAAADSGQPPATRPGAERQLLPEAGGQTPPATLPATPPATPPAPGPGSLPPEQQARVNGAIDRGVQYLRTHRETNPTGHATGMAALRALTLLECGVPKDDPDVRKEVQQVRAAVPGLRETYDLSLAILCLDRVGEAGDAEAIRSMAMRLVAAQGPNGGWGYYCPALRREQERDIQAALRRARPDAPMDFFTRVPKPPAAPGTSVREEAPKEFTKPSATTPFEEQPLEKKTREEDLVRKARESLPEQLRNVQALRPPGTPFPQNPDSSTDNSNTQFAILGLLAAGRHDVPLERVFALIDRRFRVSQTKAGGWDYHFEVNGPEASPGMIGAGLIGLAVRHGVSTAGDSGGKKKVVDPAADRGLRLLGSYVGRPLGWIDPALRRPSHHSVNLYLLWTMERVGVLYNVRKMGGKEWYPWGAELILKAQRPDGSWSEGGMPKGYWGATATTDTCFALLFLRRANFTKDLSDRFEFFTEGKRLEDR